MKEIMCECTVREMSRMLYGLVFSILNPLKIKLNNKFGGVLFFNVHIICHAISAALSPEVFNLLQGQCRKPINSGSTHHFLATSGSAGLCKWALKHVFTALNSRLNGHSSVWESLKYTGIAKSSTVFFRVLPML